MNFSPHQGAYRRISYLISTVVSQKIWKLSKMKEREDSVKIFEHEDAQEDDIYHQGALPGISELTSTGVGLSVLEQSK